MSRLFGTFIYFHFLGVIPEVERRRVQSVVRCVSTRVNSAMREHARERVPDCYNIKLQSVESRQVL
jgi:hypothetical protein